MDDENNYILQRISLKEIPESAWSPIKWWFVERCRISGNPEALFRKGMIAYFSHGMLEEGFQWMNTAAREGHLAACYVLGVILLCQSDHASEEEGRRLLSFVRNNNGTGTCREKVCVMRSSLWLCHRLTLKPNECPRKDIHIRRGWEEDVVDLSCEICACYLDVEFVCSWLR